MADIVVRKVAFLNERYIGRSNATDLCGKFSGLPCLKTFQIFIPDGAQATDSSHSFKLHYTTNKWAEREVREGRRPASFPTLYALYTGPNAMRKLALLRNKGEHHFNLIDVTLRKDGTDDLTYAYVPDGGSLSWDNFKINPNTLQISIETDDDAKQPKRTWAVATPKGRSGPRNIISWDGESVDNKYNFELISLKMVPA
jgi:hypothetical protein